MKEATRRAVKSFIKDFVERRTSKAKEFSLEDLRKAYPFHGLFFRDDALVAFKLQRSIVTAMGRGFYPQIAKLVAQDNYQEVYLDYQFAEELDVEQCNKIEEIVTGLRTGRRKPSHSQELEEILSTRSSRKRGVRIIADLYINDFSGGPFFTEIKTPLPNLDICAESKKKLLYFWAITSSRGRLADNAYLSFPYNPYVRRELYKWPYTPKVLDMNRQVLIGEEFWDMVGGSHTYETLLEVIDDVREETSLR